MKTKFPRTDCNDKGVIVKLDGDYIVYAGDTKNDYNVYTFFGFLKQGVADYFGMSSLLMSGYLAGLDPENDFMTVDVENGVYRILSKEWDMKGLDTMCVDEKAVEDIKNLSSEPYHIFVNYSKTYVKAYGTADNFAVVVAEYGENSQLTYQSIMATVQTLFPDNYSVLKKYYTELKEVSDADGYTVSFGLDKTIAEEHEMTADERYSYVTVTFKAPQ